MSSARMIARRFHPLRSIIQRTTSARPFVIAAEMKSGHEQTWVMSAVEVTLQLQQDPETHSATAGTGQLGRRTPKKILEPSHWLCPWRAPGSSIFDLRALQQCAIASLTLIDAG
ncbi:hypothetical protein GGI35DRAFT_468564 [Trichoderma velutinum]